MDRHQLGAFLRLHRERLDPASIGLPAAGPRRTPGLRREEVAALAHVSAQHYTRLEQGRGSLPSRAVLGSLARALRLDDAQRRHLFALAGEAFSAPPGPPSDVPEHIHELIARLRDTAVLVLDAKYDVLAWNPLAAALIEDFSALPPRERNTLRRHFLHPDPTHGMVEDGHLGRLAVGHLRATAARYPDDAPTQQLVRDLRRGSLEFIRLWNTSEVIERRHQIKTFIHPAIGTIRLHSDMLGVPDRDQRVVLMTAEPGTPDETAIRLLSVIGTQRMGVAE
ncbi:helix-turn-helix transcriptional regulator [Pseudonocardia sp. MH-G8]|uniref:helix-turn-helix transcriptional regulator n=1 Tax=Pseudonocardia sp. MH-G8 TaxID=1854588 RepID=UPI000B9FE37D|nr:helix-turn-helix transcriptional regulator [Pseudonocardia sp. MH-G8]OZM75824.1 transcriptional regulator [Pseudonocardia sp. MH-G8]